MVVFSVFEPVVPLASEQEEESDPIDSVTRTAIATVRETNGYWLEYISSCSAKVK